jgi:GntR family transcriptional regulator
MPNGVLAVNQPGTGSRSHPSNRLRADQRPLYVQASDALRQLVRSGGYAPGARLPSEIELSERLGISRPTLREALRMLEEEGTILRRHGVGTFVAQPVPVIEGGLEVLESIERMAERHGLSTHMAEASIVERAATPGELRALTAGSASGQGDASAPQGAASQTSGALAGITPLMGVTVATRVIVADGQRVAFLTDVVPQDLLRAAELGEGFHGSVLDVFLQRGWPQLAHSRTELVAEAAEDEVARWLHLQRGAPLLKLDAQLYAQDGRVVDYSLSYFVPGYFRFHVVRRVG